MIQHIRKRSRSEQATSVDHESTDGERMEGYDLEQDRRDGGETTRRLLEGYHMACNNAR